jgi:pentatricopeptide repeat protein
MDTESNVDTSNAVNHYWADIGVGVVFGLGYYLIKYLYGENQKQDAKQLKESTNICWDNAKTTEEFNSLIKSNEEDSKLAPFEILNKINKKGLSADISTYNYLLNSCYVTSKFETADKLIEEVFDITSPVQPDLSTYNILLKGISCRIDQIQGHDHISLNEKEQMIQKMNNLLEDLKKSTSTKPNHITVNTVLDILIKAGEIKQAWDLFDNMKSLYGIEPDKYSYSTIIKALKYNPEKSRLDKAFGILEFLKNKTSNINDEIIFNCLIEVCVKLGQIEKAENLFKEMKEINIAPTKITYAIMIKGFGQVYQLDRAFEIFEEMINNNIAPNEIIYGVLLNACVRSSNIAKVTQVYKDIKQRNIEMNVILYTTLIKAYTKVKDLDSALEVYKTMLDDTKVEKNIAVHNAMLDCCVECNKIDKLNEIYEQIKSKAIEDENHPQPDLITYSTVIKGYCRAKEMSQVFKIYDFLKTRDDFKLDEVVYNSILDGCAKAGSIENATIIYQDMKTKNIPKSNVTYSILIKLYSNSKQDDKALGLLDEMISNKIKPGLIVYTCLIQTCLKSKRFERAIELFEQMKTQGLIPDHVLYNIIVNGCLYHSRWEFACQYTLETFKVNVKMADDIYLNVLEKLCAKYCNLNNTIKCDYLTAIIMELKKKGFKIDYQVLSKASKLIFYSKGKKINFSPERKHEINRSQQLKTNNRK